MHFAPVVGGVLYMSCLGFCRATIWAAPQAPFAAALKALGHNPMKWRWLQDMLLLVVDELGQCGAALVGAMDLLLRKVR